MFIKNLTKKYDGKPVVDAVSFEIPKGKVLSLIGPNGAGKSTVMGIISRLIARDAGFVDFEGEDINKWTSKELAKRLAILTQTNNIQMKLTVRELVAFGRFPYSGGRITPEDKTIIDKAIAYMELEEFEDRFIDELSGGQRQAMALLMSTMTPIEFLILDEHTAALDPKTAELIMELTDKIVKEKNLTTIMVTHNLRYAVEYGNRLIMMHEGNVILDKKDEEKKQISVEDILTLFNEISIECGN